MDDLLTIGEVADRAGVAVSAVRYYERRGLLPADERRSGQRRYRLGSLRRLVFIRMMQDAGMSLDDVAVVLTAGDNREWKAVAHERLAALDDEIAQLEHARDALRLALLCRFDHPLTECAVMADEIDRRLGPDPPG